MPNDYSYTGVENANNIISTEEFDPSTLETIDYAFYDFVNKIMNSRATTNTGWKEVPVLWATAERAFLSKDNKDLRDQDGALILPLITIERISVQKSLTRKSAYYGLSGDNVDDPNRYGRMAIARKIVPDKTNNYAVAGNRKKFGDVYRTPGRQSYYKDTKPNEKVIYETISIPVPVSVGLNYKVSMKTEYIQQMNQLMVPFVTLGSNINSFVIQRSGHKYEAFLQSDLALNNNVSNIGLDERVFISDLSFEVIGYLIGEAPNGERPKIIKKQNAVEIKMGRERVILGDELDHIDNRGFYRG